MKKTAFAKILILFSYLYILSHLFTTPVYAEKIPALSEISADLHHSRPDLVKRKQELENEFASFLAAAKAFNAKEAKDQSDADYNALNAKRDAYINAAKTFNKEIALAKILNDRDRRVHPVDAPYTNDRNKRSAYEYHRVIEQFNLKGKPKRYDPEYYTDEKGRKKRKTFCNIFVWDVTRAMVGPDEEIPHWVNNEEVKVNYLVGWLRKEGKARGWQRLDARGAQEKANGGHPTIAIWKNPDEEHSGHVAIVRPGSVGGDRWDDRGAALAQAGSLVVDATHLATGFNDPDFSKDIEFWSHE